MNLFVTSKDPLQAARHLDDVRTNKIILEAAQVLSVALLQRGVAGYYKPTHEGAGVTRWVCADERNMRWTLQYGIALCEEYKRFGHKPFHKSEIVLRDMQSHIPWLGPLPTQFQNSARNEDLGLDFSHLPVVTAYRTYLCARWPGDKRAPKWTNRPRPKWAVF